MRLWVGLDGIVVFIAHMVAKPMIAALFYFGGLSFEKGLEWI